MWSYRYFGNNLICLQWIDTCCIDKSSSAELSEAINSMFRWYQDARICYVYLPDVRNKTESSHETSFKKSRWSTRGWTLQELLAPEIVVFFSHDWSEIGTKATLAELISVITGIDSLSRFEGACVAQQMSWASKGQTTRIEDQSYCLMGLLGVNMPIIYGEGEGAFLRLQMAIVAEDNDESLFAWRDTPLMSGLLASRPASFEESGNARKMKSCQSRDHYLMTMIRIWEASVGLPSSMGLSFVVPLNCENRAIRSASLFVSQILRVRTTNSTELFAILGPRNSPTEAMESQSKYFASTL